MRRASATQKGTQLRYPNQRLVFICPRICPSPQPHPLSRQASASVVIAIVAVVIIMVVIISVVVIIVVTIVLVTIVVIPIAIIAVVVVAAWADVTPELIEPRQAGGRKR